MTRPEQRRGRSSAYLVEVAHDPKDAILDERLNAQLGVGLHPVEGLLAGDDIGSHLAVASHAGDVGKVLRAICEHPVRESCVVSGVPRHLVGSRQRRSEAIGRAQAIEGSWASSASTGK